MAREHVPVAQALQHVGSASAVMRLAGRQLQCDRQTIGIDQRMDLAGQPAARAPNAWDVSIVPGGGRGVLPTPFYRGGVLWWMRIEEESTICTSPS
jgi:hypothetical protein